MAALSYRLGSQSYNAPRVTEKSISSRLPNLDLLRVLCAVFVVFEHFCEEGAFNAFGYSRNSSLVAHILLRLIYGIARTAVPVFFLISGYLSINSNKQKLGKPISLFLMTFFYSLIPVFSSVVLQIVHGKFELSSDLIKTISYALLVKNYYLYLFVALYLLSPFINHAIGEFSKKQFFRIIFISIMLFSVWSTVINTFLHALDLNYTGVFFISREGTSMGFNIVNFAMLYLIGGYIKLYPVSNVKMTRIFSILIVLLSAVITTTAKMLVPNLSKALYFYDSFFVIASAIALFTLFTTLSIQSIGAISFAGKKTFGTFLIHNYVLYSIERFLTVEEIVGKGFSGTIAGILIFVLGGYLISVIMCTFISAIFTPVNNFWKKTRLYNLRIFIEK